MEHLLMIAPEPERPRCLRRRVPLRLHDRVLARRRPSWSTSMRQRPARRLLHLLREEQIEIAEIPIARIADQFLQAIHEWDSTRRPTT